MAANALQNYDMQCPEDFPVLLGGSCYVAQTDAPLIWPVHLVNQTIPFPDTIRCWFWNSLSNDYDFCWRGWIACAQGTLEAESVAAQTVTLITPSPPEPEPYF